MELALKAELGEPHPGSDDEDERETAARALADSYDRATLLKALELVGGHRDGRAAVFGLRQKMSVLNAYDADSACASGAAGLPDGALCAADHGRSAGGVYGR